MKKNKLTANIPDVVSKITKADVLAKVTNLNKPQLDNSNTILNVSAYALGMVIFRRLFKYFNVLELAISITKGLYFLYQKLSTKQGWMIIKFLLIIYASFTSIWTFIALIYKWGIWGSLIKLKAYLFIAYNESLKWALFALYDMIDWSKLSDALTRIVERASQYEGYSQDSINKLKEATRHLHSKEEFLDPEDKQALKEYYDNKNKPKLEEIVEHKQESLTEDTPWYKNKWYYLYGISTVVVIWLAYKYSYNVPDVSNLPDNPSAPSTRTNTPDPGEAPNPVNNPVFTSTIAHKIHNVTSYFVSGIGAFLSSIRDFLNLSSDTTSIITDQAKDLEDFKRLAKESANTEDLIKEPESLNKGKAREITPQPSTSQHTYPPKPYSSNLIIPTQRAIDVINDSAQQILDENMFKRRKDILDANNIMDILKESIQRRDELAKIYNMHKFPVATDKNINKALNRINKFIEFLGNEGYIIEDGYSSDKTAKG